MIKIKQILFKAGVAFLAAYALHSPAFANDAPSISPSLKKMLGALPIAGMKDQLQQLSGALKQTPCGAKLTGCYATQAGPLQLYLFTSSSAQQTFLLVIDKKMAMPTLLKSDVQKLLGGSSLQSPIISISTANYAIDKLSMPPALQKVVNDSYFGVNSLEFEGGVQLAARISLNGAVKLLMENMGAKVDQLTMRAAVVMPIPTDLMGGVGTGAGIAAAVSEGDTMQKAGIDAAKPEAYIEFQFGPDSVVTMNYPQIRLTDATFFINNQLTFGYKGNASFAGATDKKVLMHFQTPLTPLGGMDMLDFQFLMATPASFTLEDTARVMVAMASPDPRLAKYGGGFIRNINSYKSALLNMTKPLSMFKVTNPIPAPEYRFGDASKPFPEDASVFNFVILGPLADGGPRLRAIAELDVMGQKMGWMEASGDINGFRSTVGRSLTVKLGPLGVQTFKVVSTNTINLLVSTMNLKGNFAGQDIEVTWSPIEVALKMNASCVNPFEINALAKITPDLDLAKFFELQTGVNFDPAKINGCLGKELEAAYKKIAGEYKNLSGYTANAANEELRKIAAASGVALKATEDAAKKAADDAKKTADDARKVEQQAADVAKKKYEDTKNAARNVASKASSSVNQAFNDAGNAFKSIGSIGKKKKHSKKPDPKFAATVFDWDYYYDNYPDVVRSGGDLAAHWRDNGFAEGRRGSSVFNAKYYLSRYSDVQKVCSGNLQCGLQHWLDYGVYEGRQGSADFSVRSYMNRYPDLMRAFGPDKFPDALVHWLNNGEDEGRNGGPDTQETGPIVGPYRTGGGGGGAWSDDAVCKGNYVNGWIVYSGSKLDSLQFLYGSTWAPKRGGSGGGRAQVNLPDGEYVVRVDYRSGSEVDSVKFITNKGRAFSYGGGGGNPGTYLVSPGEKLGCLQGRSGARTDQLTFWSTGPR